MASVTSICNRALQRLGAARILAITDDNKNGRACNAAYDAVRRSELRKHTWVFAKKPVVLAPLVETDPLGLYTYIFQLPSDCLRIIKPRDPYLDWVIKGRKLYTNDGNTLSLDYIVDEQDPNQYDSIFDEALALAMAMAMCEEITGSTSKNEAIKSEYKDIVRIARNTNAMETIPAEPEDDTWTLARY